MSDKLCYDYKMTAEELGQKVLDFETHGQLFEIDVSSWDGSLVKEWLEFEIRVIEEVMPYLPKNWEVLKARWCDDWRTSRGLSVKMDYGRKSGDAWTSSFNTLINLCILFHIDREMRAVAKGDDNFFATKLNIDKEQLEKFYLSIGMQAKIKS